MLYQTSIALYCVLTLWRQSFVALRLLSSSTHSLCYTPTSVSYFPGDCEVVLSLAAGPDDQVSLVQGLHHLLCLVKTYIVEVGVGNNTLYICWRKTECKKQYKGSDVDVKIFGWTEKTFLSVLYSVLTCALPFLFELLLLFLVFGFCVKVIVGVLGKLPLIRFVHQIWRATREVNAEFLNVNFHDAAVNCHAHLEEEGVAEHSMTKVPQAMKTGMKGQKTINHKSIRTGYVTGTNWKQTHFWMRDWQKLKNAINKA